MVAPRPGEEYRPRFPRMGFSQRVMHLSAESPSKVQPSRAEKSDLVDEELEGGEFIPEFGFGFVEFEVGCAVGG